LAIGGLLFVLMTREMTRVTELLVMQGVSAFVVLKLIVYILPSFMILTLPIATLIASTCAFSRLAADHELVAIQASGIGLRRLLIPVGVFSVGIYAVAFSLSLWAQPWSGVSLKALALSMMKEQLTLPLDEGVFNDPVDGLMIYIPQTDITSKGIFIADSRNAGEPRVLVAQDWTLVSDTESGHIGLRLTDGSIHIKSPIPNTSQRVTFHTYDMQLELDTSLQSPMTEIPDLEGIYATLHASDWTDVKALKQLEEYHRTWAIPVACLIFGFIGVPLGVRSGAAGRIGGIGVGVAGILFYYLLNIFGDFLVSTLVLTPWIAAWLPNAIFIVLSVFLFRWI
jgi:lipopolysaccharide export system permease protein